jgi:hypothetical protein
VVVLVACWSFADSHIFWPQGVLTMLGFALGFGLLMVASRTGDVRQPRTRVTAGSLTNS